MMSRKLNVRKFKPVIESTESGKGQLFNVYFIFSET